MTAISVDLIARDTENVIVHDRGLIATAKVTSDVLAYANTGVRLDEGRRQGKRQGKRQGRRQGIVEAGVEEKGKKRAISQQTTQWLQKLFCQHNY